MLHLSPATRILDESRGYILKRGNGMKHIHSWYCYHLQLNVLNRYFNVSGDFTAEFQFYMDNHCTEGLFKPRITHELQTVKLKVMEYQTLGHGFIISILHFKRISQWTVIDWWNQMTEEDSNFPLVNKQNVNMAEYWPSSSSSFMDSGEVEQSIRMIKKNRANIEPSWPHIL